VARTFYYLNRLLEAKKQLASETRNWIDKLDHLLENARRGCSDPDEQPVKKEHTRWFGFICLAMLLTVNWSFVFMMR
jgi:hypothetical protein